MEEEFVKRNRKLPHELVLLEKSKNMRFGEEKPWPKSVQMAGYAALVLGVPYSIGVLLSEIPILQEGIQQFGWGKQLMDDVIRPYWGTINEHPYVVNDTEYAHVKSLDIEPNMHLQTIQSNIDAMTDPQRQLPVTLTHATSATSQTEQVLTLPADTHASPQHLAHILQQDIQAPPPLIGLDFLHNHQNDQVEEQPLESSTATLLPLQLIWPNNI